MSKVSVYFNSSSTNARKDDVILALKKTSSESDISFYSPENLEELQSNIKNDLKNDCKYILAVGGDGTVNSLIQKIHSTQINLMVIPKGAANDLANELQMSSIVKDNIQHLNEHQAIAIDLLKVNDKYMATNGGVGIAAEVALNVNRDRKKYPTFKYLLKMTKSQIYALYFIKEILGSKFKRHSLAIDSADSPRLGKRIKASMVFVSNQKSLGSNFLIAPKTSNNDGTFNVSIFTHKNKLELIKVAIQIYRGKYPYGDKNIISFETKKVQITALEEDLTFFGDGEILSKGKHFSVEVCNKALNVISAHKRGLYH